ncbi:MAG: condensation domain-containing protein, partial [Blastocatellia bacterium]
MEREIIEGFELSPQQKRLWLLQQGRNAYSSQCTILIEGELNKEVLTEALEKVAVRHEILRTTFHALPGVYVPIQTISSNGLFDYREADLSYLDPEEREASIEELSREDWRRDWDFERGPLVRFTLIALSKDRHSLLASLPSMCADRWSLKTLLHDISHAYATSFGVDDYSDEVVQYADYAAWQTKLLESDEAIAAREYWRAQSQLLNAIDNLPFEKSDDAASKFDPGSIAFELPRDVAQNVFSVIDRCNVSAAEFFLACWQTLLWTLTKNSDIVIGYVSNGRKYEPLKTALGLYARSVPFHTHFENDFLFSEVLKSVVRAARDLHTQEDCFFWNESLSASEDPPFFSVGFEYEEGEEKREWGGVSFSLVKHESIIDRFKLCMSCVRQTDSLSLILRFDAARFESASVELMMSYFSRLLESAAGNPELQVGELEVLGPDLSAKVLVDWNKTHQSFGVFRSIQELLEGQVEESPDGTAVKYLDQSITFRELNACANRLAHHLIRRGAGPESRVVLFLERSIDMIWALWAVWKSRAALIPLDIAQPRARLKLMLDQARPTLILTHRDLVGLLPETEGTVIALDEEAVGRQIRQCSAENPEQRVEPNNLAYLIYTSGSTGIPKGAMVEHHSVTNLLYALDDAIYDHQRGS